MKHYKTWSTPVIEERRVTVPCALCGGESFKPYFNCEGFSYVICTNCSLIQQNPQPESAAVIKRYNENDYLGYELQNEAAFLRLALLGLKDAGFADLEKRFLTSGRKRILDIGCAQGALLAYLRGRGWETAGVEPCAAQAAYGKTRGLDICAASLEEAALPNEYFDAAIASHVIEHSARPDCFVKTAARALKSGGCLFISTPNIAGFQAKLFGPLWRSAIFDHLYLFSRKTLRSLLEKHGFIIEKTVTWGGLAAGTAPPVFKKIADKAVKIFGAGDVMLMRARKTR